MCLMAIRISEIQEKILLYIHENPGCACYEAMIRDQLRLKVGSAGTILRRMRERGLLENIPVPKEFLQDVESTSFKPSAFYGLTERGAELVGLLKTYREQRRKRHAKRQ